MFPIQHIKQDITLYDQPAKYTDWKGRHVKSLCLLFDLLVFIYVVLLIHETDYFNYCSCDDVIFITYLVGQACRAGEYS